jgi:hypothetical protein
MKKRLIYLAIPMTVLVIFSLLLCSCAETDDVKETASAKLLDGTEATLTLSGNSGPQSEGADSVIWDKRGFFEIGKTTFESVNNVLYADYLATDEGKTGAKKSYFFTVKDGLYDFSNRVIPLANDQISELEAIINRSGYVFDNINISEGRISYIFGLGLRQYIYTFDGKPPAYYFKEGDRNPLYPREEHFGGNWYYVKTGG